MTSQELLLMQLYGGGLMSAGSWLKVVFLVFLLWVPVVRPERIRNASLYRRAYICFGLSIIIPSASTLVMSAAMSPGGMGGGIGNSPFMAAAGLGQLLGVAGPVLFGISLICALRSVVPGFIPPQDTRATATLRPPRTDDSSPGGPSAAESQSP